MNIKTVVFFALFLFISNNVYATQTKDVFVTIKPLHSLVSGVIGDTGKAVLLIENDISPHDFKLRPSQIKDLQEANIIFYIDEYFETFFQSLFKILPAHVRKAPVAQKAGINLLSHRVGDSWEAHAHDEHAHDEHANDEHAHDEHAHDENAHDEHANDEHAHDEHAHDEHAHDEHAHDEHAHDEHAHDEHAHDEHAHDEHHKHAYDFHIWLDPKNARHIVKFIVRELSALYPENSDIYQKNGHQMTKKIESMDIEIKDLLKNLDDKPFIVFHDAYQYFERAYDLKAIGSITIEPHKSPSPKRIQEIRKKLKETKAQCVFSEPQFSDRLVKTVSEGTNAKTGSLDPLGANLDDGEALYFNLIRNMANNFKLCLDHS
ncbi:MAG: zinc ABC transporter substrate-binding protein [Pseudomonadota bacterium]